MPHCTHNKQYRPAVQFHGVLVVTCLSTCTNKCQTEAWRKGGWKGEKKREEGERRRERREREEERGGGREEERGGGREEERGGGEKKWREEGESSSYLASSRLPHSRTHDVIEIRPELLEHFVCCSTDSPRLHNFSARVPEQGKLGNKAR